MALTISDEIDIVMQPWQFKGRDVCDADIIGQYGFVYEITDTLNDRLYIGRKYLVKPAKKKVLLKNGKTKLQKVLVPSDWPAYFSSNKIIGEQVKEDPSRFTREILVFCKGKGECSYLETKMQFDRDALIDPRYYNGIVNCRLNERCVLNLRAEFLAQKDLLLLGSV